MKVFINLNLGTFYFITPVAEIIDSPNGFHFITLMLTYSLITVQLWHYRYRVQQQIFIKKFIYFSSAGIFWPEIAAIKFSAVKVAIRVRVWYVAEPMWGISTQFSNLKWKKFMSYKYISFCNLLWEICNKLILIL